MLPAMLLENVVVVADRLDQIESNVAVVLHDVGGIRARLDSMHRQWAAVCTVDSERRGPRKLYHVRPVRPGIRHREGVLMLGHGCRPRSTRHGHTHVYVPGLVHIPVVRQFAAERSGDCY